ncbi:signal peptide containing protein [Theileria equi strain WA]|uniref:Signal peptide containing protein n=1 Tax=Theileria equi strain WA TaxID=1537102 RepID=L1LB16_THEEQ|nr:signal peptide containing protein [Theileria equi strain WA]EKX72521.1 signal peptide containing protein [Theileria equi strain WA]|eukprot:XP_004831973.1 signal peptide containing protein [Theileria equi strain WA]
MVDVIVTTPLRILVLATLIISILCLDLKDTREYWSEKNSTGEKYLVSVDFRNGNSSSNIDPPQGFRRYIHKMDSGYKFCVERIKHQNFNLTICPCIEEVNEATDPLLLCIKRSMHNSEKTDSTYCYYCKVEYSCWYRYKNGECNEILPGNRDTATGLGKLL